MQHVQRSPSQHNLEVFLKAMAADPARREDYSQHPQQLMNQFGLDEHSQAMVLQGDTQAIWRELNDEGGDEQPIPIILISAFNR